MRTPKHPPGTALASNVQLPLSLCSGCLTNGAGLGRSPPHIRHYISDLKASHGGCTVHTQPSCSPITGCAECAQCYRSYELELCGAKPLHSVTTEKMCKCGKVPPNSGLLGHMHLSLPCHLQELIKLGVCGKDAHM